ncbi:TetR family transcriptional regulator [Cryptosporangium arvum]|uniref:TetR family transcriptional regulator n=1 Tax=Cryptosporangium arvum TaxID=80871 RepID=UPI0004B263A5|nr:TetR family transcriptional regulator [Cryptosporangium arvum]
MVDDAIVNASAVVRYARPKLTATQIARRQRILSAALRALDSGEYEHIQMRSVAQAADVALGTVYRYFPSKEYLYASAVLEWAVSAPELAPAREVAGHLRPEERLRIRLHTIIRAFELRPWHYRVHVALRTTADARAAALIAATERDTRMILAYDLDALGPAAAEDTALMLWAVVDAALREAIIRGGEVSEAYRVVDRFIDLLVTPLRWASPPVTAGDGGGA